MSVRDAAETGVDETNFRSQAPQQGSAGVLAAKAHRTDIDGLRAVAVLSVIGFHTQCPGFSGGYVGVDVFFVISGYLICSILLRELGSGSFSFARFYERRAKRILPALIAILLFCIVFGLFVLSPAEEKHLGSQVMAAIASVSNVQFYLQGNYFDRGGILNPLLMTWSLAVEEQFYLVFPVVLILVYRFRRRHIFNTLLLGCVLSFVLSVHSQSRHPEFNFFLPFTRAWELGAGTLLAVWQSERSRPSGGTPRWRLEVAGAAGFLLILGCVLRYSSTTLFPGLAAAIPVAGTVLLLIAQGSVVNRALGWKPFRATGQISYSLYLWHWPLLSFAAIVSLAPEPPAVRAALMLVALVAATLSYFAVETPFRSSRAFGTAATLRLYGAAVLAVFLLGGLLIATRGFAWRNPSLAKLENSLQLDRPHNCIIYADRGPLLNDLCYPPPSSTAAAALLGDSHAEAISGTLRSRLAGEGQKLLVLASYSCPPLAGYTRTLAEDPAHAGACARFNREALQLLAQRPDVKTVYLAGSWAMLPEDSFVAVGMGGAQAAPTAEGSERNLLAGLTGEIAALEASGRQVVLIDDWPSLPYSPIDRIKAGQMAARRRLADAVSGPILIPGSPDRILRSELVPPLSEKLRQDLLDLTSKDPKLRFIDTKSIFCPDAMCLVSSDGNPLYADSNHLDQFGAGLLISHLNK